MLVGADKIGQTINHWKVLEIDTQLGKFECTKCNKIYTRAKKDILTGKTKQCNDCRSNKEKPALENSIRNHWLVTELDHINENCKTGRFWKVQCDKCSKEKITCEHYLLTRLAACSKCYPRKYNVKFREDLTGQRINNWQVLHKSKNLKRYQYWTCKCVPCGKTRDIYVQYIFKTVECLQCRSVKKRGYKNKGWKGCGEISGTAFRSIMKGAKARNLDFTITIEYIWDLFLKQDGKCALTGSKLEFPIHLKETAASTASLDRIDSSQGYIEGNVQWVHKKINLMKRDLHPDEFIQYCKLVAKHCKSRKK